MEQQLAEYMMRFAKFEFFLMRVDPGFVQKNKENRVTGVQWDMLANEVEKVFPWATFDFDNSGFAIFKDQPPQYLIIREDHSLDWDGDADPVDDWSKLLTKSFAQFRNNIAHGSKGNPPRPFTHGRTPVFLAAGHNLMNFLTAGLFDGWYWDEELHYE
ncbi:hypothetical protein EV217_5126 [Phyllobacterium myrsinacearum]|uniref:hypothetical protein n=1 Tax=Phyllobacterium myrsinacearum TaxID=28101 RepID=UPI00102A46CF|nr:hypothetical protein [Phyllobacterium myrsinacearum]RZS76894.1 hypothetical protein EV217_5126 [Phyllobacterium myrsinacearum]